MPEDKEYIPTLKGLEYMVKIMLLGFETGRGNKDAYKDVFGKTEEKNKVEEKYREASFFPWAASLRGKRNKTNG